jgi:DNA-binding CsgD family transcriptional regulator
MGSPKGPQMDRRTQGTFCVQPKTFVFFDKMTRTHRFEVKALADGTVPTAEAASLLAMQCVMRGKTPRDFGVMVGIDTRLLNGLERQAQELIDACVTMHFDVRLSQRQRQVLRGVLQDLSNKQIAEQLEIGVRTVKFHVSALLTKFGVSNRAGLAQKAGGLMSGSTPSAKLAVLKTAAETSPRGRFLNSGENRPTINFLERRSHG